MKFPASSRGGDRSGEEGILYDRSESFRSWDDDDAVQGVHGENGVAALRSPTAVEPGYDDNATDAYRVKELEDGEEALFRIAAPGCEADRITVMINRVDDHFAAMDVADLSLGFWELLDDSREAAHQDAHIGDPKVVTFGYRDRMIRWQVPVKVECLPLQKGEAVSSLVWGRIGHVTSLAVLA